MCKEVDKDRTIQNAKTRNMICLVDFKKSKRKMPDKGENGLGKLTNSFHFIDISQLLRYKKNTHFYSLDLVTQQRTKIKPSEFSLLVPEKCDKRQA